MSMLLHHPKTSPALPTLRWTAPDEGLWTADHAGVFAGTVDQNGTHFYVRNGFSEYLGDYRTLPAAQTALAQYLEATC